MNNLPKVATQWNSGATRDSNRGRRVLIPSALTTRPPSHTSLWLGKLVRRLASLRILHNLLDPACSSLDVGDHLIYVYFPIVLQ